MTELPEYKLIGSPKRIKVKSVLVSTYYQHYRLPPDLRVKRAPCCRDKQQSERKCIKYVEDHIKKGLAKDNPVIAHANATIEQHLTVYRQSLDADENTAHHVGQTIRRIEKICEGLHWKKISDVDGPAMKVWLKKQKGICTTTRGYYVSSFKSFTKFLAENSRIERDPLVYLKTKTKGDKPKPSRIRRALTPDEVNRLINAARTSETLVQKLSGPARAWLYRLAVAVGFRAQELASLTPLSFSLDEACVLLERSHSKRRRYDRVELHPSLLDGLRVWLSDKEPHKKLWGGYWWNRAAEMIRHDLAVAGIPVVDDAGHVVDFHAMRTTFVTRLVGTSVPVALVQRIARLSTPSLLDRYYKPHDEARTEAIAAMPALV